MKNIKEYLKSIRFALGYSFRFVPIETFATAIFAMTAGFLPYGSAYLLGKLVNIIVAGAKSGSYTGVWLVLFLYALAGALPTIFSNIRAYFSRRRYLVLQNEIDLSLLKKREEIDIATYENPKFQDLIQRTFRNGSQPIWSLGSSQFDMLQAVTSLMVGTVLAIHFNIFIYLIVIITAVPSFLADISYSSKAWTIWKKDSPEQRRMVDLRQHLISKTFLIEAKLLQA